MPNEIFPPPSIPPIQKIRNKLLAFGKAALKWLFSPGAALIIILVALILAAIGIKNVQIGGLLGKLFGKKSPENRAIDTANSVPPNRIDNHGNIIPEGVPDEHGMTQVQVVPIENPGIFSNPDTVKFTPPGESKPTEVVLPEGVKAKDVDKVIVVKPGKIIVTVKNDSGINANKVDDLLKKYG